MEKVYTEENEKKLLRLLNIYDLSTMHEQRKLLLMYLELLFEKNKTLNLTRITDIDSALILHIVDSLLLSKFMSCSEEDSFCDIGTGGGVPGIPLGCVLECKGLLIDSIGKKISAVNEFAEQLGIQDRIIAKQMRAEEIEAKMKRSFRFVVARAVAKANVVMEYAEPFLIDQGKLLLQKANIEEKELQDALQMAKLCGFKMVSRETFELPNEFGHREILIFQKNKKSRIILPRKNGEAKKHPLCG